MDYDAMRAGMQSAIPFNTHVGLEIVEVAEGRGVVKLPDKSELRNHAGSQHAGALFAAGEAASGAAFVGVFGDRLEQVTPLVGDAQIRYKQRAQGAITASGQVSQDAVELLEVLDEDGEVSFCVDVDLQNAHGDTVAEMTVNWTVRASKG